MVEGTQMDLKMRQGGDLEHREGPFVRIRDEGQLRLLQDLLSTRPHCPLGLAAGGLDGQYQPVRRKQVQQSRRANELELGDGRRAQRPADAILPVIDPPDGIADRYGTGAGRAEERRGGKGCVSNGRVGWSAAA